MNLDLQVAKALELLIVDVNAPDAAAELREDKLTFVVSGDVLLWLNKPGTGCCVEYEQLAWSPSGNWNDAMWAAEWCGLFSIRKHMLIQYPDGEYAVISGESRFLESIGVSDAVSHGHVGPLAICEAIIELKRLDELHSAT